MNTLDLTTQRVLSSYIQQLEAANQRLQAELEQANARIAELEPKDEKSEG